VHADSREPLPGDRVALLAVAGLLRSCLRRQGGESSGWHRMVMQSVLMKMGFQLAVFGVMMYMMRGANLATARLRRQHALG
jgi:hypothetical protein